MFFFFFLDKCLDVSPLQRTLTKPWRNTDTDTDANPRFTIAVHLRIFTFVIRKFPSSITDRRRAGIFYEHRTLKNCLP